MENCVFCQQNNLEIIAENKLALAFYDGCPVNSGHVLIIPRRHIETYFDASIEEHTAIIRLTHRVKEYLQKQYNPDGYNIGANVGAAAGQTVFHFHIHIIPRYRGDVRDPRGGVRKVIPHRSPEFKVPQKNSLH
ncbi:MAG: HIT family protein [Bacillota bacterium]